MCSKQISLLFAHYEKYAYRKLLYNINSHIFNHYVCNVSKLNYVNYRKCRSEQHKNNVNMHINIDHSMKYK